MPKPKPKKSSHAIIFPVLEEDKPLDGEEANEYEEVTAAKKAISDFLNSKLEQELAECFGGPSMLL